MKMFKKSMGVAAMITAGLLVAGMAPESAMAASHKSKAKAKTTVKHHHHATSSSSASSVSSTDRRLRAMEDELASLRAELNRAKQVAPAKVQEIEARQTQVEQQVAETKAIEEKNSNDDMVFFRGGYTQMAHSRQDELLVNNATLSAVSGIPDPTSNRDGWYVGGGFDFRLTDDIWGLTDLASLDAELMLQYMNFGSNTNAYVGSQLVGLGLPATGMKNQITQLTISASPKLKFNLLDGALRPWIIPFGLSINIISPPAAGVTVLNPGLMIGTGVEYNIWKALWAGIDFRYNFTGDDLNYKYKVGNTTILNGVNTDGFTTGAYLGIGF